MEKDDKDKRSFPVKFAKYEKVEIIDFALAQTNWNDTVRYLIEKEIYENGIRNLSKIIPKERDNEYFDSLFKDRDIKRQDIKIESNTIRIEKIEAANKPSNEDPEELPSEEKEIDKPKEQVENVVIFDEYM